MVTLPSLRWGREATSDDEQASREACADCGLGAKYSVGAMKHANLFESFPALDRLGVLLQQVLCLCTAQAGHGPVQVLQQVRLSPLHLNCADGKQSAHQVEATLGVPPKTCSINIKTGSCSSGVIALARGPSASGGLMFALRGPGTIHCTSLA